jgi:hypothetical protein
MAEARLRTTDLRAELALAIPNHRSFLGVQLNHLKEKQIDLDAGGQWAQSWVRHPDALGKD